MGDAKLQCALERLDALHPCVSRCLGSSLYICIYIFMYIYSLYSFPWVGGLREASMCLGSVGYSKLQCALGRWVTRSFNVPWVGGLHEASMCLM